MALLRKFLLSFASLVLVLIAAELGLRLIPSRHLGFEYKNGRFRRPTEFQPDSTRNSLGMHDAEPAPWSEGLVRVLLLGDSYVASASVTVPETVGQRLERYLNTQNERFDVLSLARPGWGQRMQLQALNTFGPRFKPALVITLFLSLNDVRNNHPPLQERALRQLRDMQRFRPGWVHMAKESAPLFYLEGSRLNQLVSHRLATYRSRRSDLEIPLDYMVYSRDYDQEWEHAWQTTTDLIRRTRVRCDHLRARYMVVSASTPHGVLGQKVGLEALFKSYPAMRRGTFDLDWPDHRLARLCEAEGIPLLRLEPPFRELTAQGHRLHWQYGGHWNAAGNDQAGRLIAEFIRRDRERGQSGRNTTDVE